MKNYIAMGALAALAGSGVAFAAQAPAGQAPATLPAPQAQTQAAPAQGATTTLVGCVYRERDVPGRAPNVAERIGVLEDYIFAEVPSSPIASARSPESTAAAAPGSTPGAVGTSGAMGSMYKLEFVDDDKLKDMVGKRVEIVGRIDAEAGDQAAPAPGTRTTTADKVLGRDRVDLAEFEVSTIKEVAGTCPANPDPKP
jgi:hypothetical protein